MSPAVLVPLWRALNAPEGRSALVGVCLVLLCRVMFVWGRSSAPAPEPQVVCAPVLQRTQECLDDLVQAHKVCAERVLQEAEAARAQERTLLSAKSAHTNQTRIKRACEVCEAGKRGNRNDP